MAKSMIALRASVYAPAAYAAGIPVAMAARIYGRSAINDPVPGRPRSQSVDAGGVSYGSRTHGRAA
eukprot:3981886-Lingulodinium_polyedra.AAC.1